MKPKRKDSLTSCSNDWNKVQGASLLDLAWILIFYQAKSCVNVSCGPHVIHLGDSQYGAKSCPSQEGCFSGKM